MALSNYSEIKSAVADWLDRGDLTDRIPDFIRLAELRIYRELRIPPMENVVELTTTNNIVALPANFLEMRAATIKAATDVPLRRVGYRNQPKTLEKGTPTTFARRGGDLILHPTPETETTVELYYYADQGSITDDTDGSSWFTSNAPDLLLYGALLEAHPYLKDDERIVVWQTAFKEAMRTLQSMADDSEYAGAEIVVRTTSGVY